MEIARVYWALSLGCNINRHVTCLHGQHSGQHCFLILLGSNPQQFSVSLCQLCSGLVTCPGCPPPLTLHLLPILKKPKLSRLEITNINTESAINKKNKIMVFINLGIGPFRCCFPIRSALRWTRKYMVLNILLNENLIYYYYV